MILKKNKTNDIDFLIKIKVQLESLKKEYDTSAVQLRKKSHLIIELLNKKTYTKSEVKKIVKLAFNVHMKDLYIEVICTHFVNLNNHTHFLYNEQTIVFIIQVAFSVILKHTNMLVG